METPEIEAKSDEPRSLAEAAQPVNPKNQPVPGVTPHVPKVPANAPEYVVVNSPVFYGRLYEIGERVRHPGPVIKELGSPGRCLKPVGHKGPWPPLAFREAERKAAKKAREEWIKDLHRF